jgi:hypothetical protein
VTKKAKECSICGGPFTALEKKYWLGGGHNAWPINDGRCCTKCNEDVVTPERIRGFQEYLASKAMH